MKTFRSNGKLLLTGEYVVLDGATALVLPTRHGQLLKVDGRNDGKVHWKSNDHTGNTWFEAEYIIKDGQLVDTFKSKSALHTRLKQVLNSALQLNPEMMSSSSGYTMISELEFPRNWGLGSSSTLINNIANCFEINPYVLLDKTFGGSGFDIASAQHNHPITYSIAPHGRKILTSSFDPDFHDELFFIHLNEKQNSRDSISHYRQQPKEQLEGAVKKISAITHQIATCSTIEEFELLLDIHETIISKTIQLPKLKKQRFHDYPRTIKSLGGWGGDFILATGKDAEKDYFRKKGYHTVLNYQELVLQ